MAARISGSRKWLLGGFFLFAFIAPLLVLGIFWFVRVAQERVVDAARQVPVWLEPASKSTVSMKPGPKCRSRLAGNFVVADCAGGARVAQLLGLRVVPPETFEAVFGKVFESQGSAIAAPALDCTFYELSAPVVLEPLVSCEVGGEDLGKAALRSGQVVLTQKGSVSRALLKLAKLDDGYVEAEEAARLERRGLWWDYPRGNAIDVSVQAWIAQVLVLVGGIVAFFYQRGREAALERAKLLRLENKLKLAAKEVEEAVSRKDWTKALTLAEAAGKLLAEEGLSKDVLACWRDVEEQLRGKSEITTVQEYVKEFLEVLKKDPALGLGPH